MVGTMNRTWSTIQNPNMFGIQAPTVLDLLPTQIPTVFSVMRIYNHSCLFTVQSTWNTGRRTKLPAMEADTSGVNLWNLLCRNIGKDLSKISMPVTLNEPLSVLQRLCEELVIFAVMLTLESRCKLVWDEVSFV